jgi:hypothetical protein
VKSLIYILIINIIPILSYSSECKTRVISQLTSFSSHEKYPMPEYFDAIDRNPILPNIGVKDVRICNGKKKVGIYRVTHSNVYLEYIDFEEAKAYGVEHCSSLTGIFKQFCTLQKNIDDVLNHLDTTSYSAAEKFIIKDYLETESQCKQAPSNFSQVKEKLQPTFNYYLDKQLKGTDINKLLKKHNCNSKVQTGPDGKYLEITMKNAPDVPLGTFFLNTKNSNQTINWAELSIEGNKIKNLPDNEPCLKMLREAFRIDPPSEAGEKFFVKNVMQLQKLFGNESLKLPKFKKPKFAKIGPKIFSDLSYVNVGEDIVLKNKPVYTYGLAPCIAIVIHNKTTGEVSLSHAPGGSYNATIEEIERMGNGELEMYLAGGYTKNNGIDPPESINDYLEIVKAAEDRGVLIKGFRSKFNNERDDQIAFDPRTNTIY